jgi:hypothetical protein
MPCGFLSISESTIYRTKSLGGTRQKLRLFLSDNLFYIVYIIRGHLLHRHPTIPLLAVLRLFLLREHPFYFRYSTRLPTFVCIRIINIGSGSQGKINNFLLLSKKGEKRLLIDKLKLSCLHQGGNISN